MPNKQKEDLISQEEFNELSSKSEINNVPLPHNSNFDDENRDSLDETLMGMEYALDEPEEDDALDEDRITLRAEFSEDEDENEEDEKDFDYALEDDEDFTPPQIDRTDYSSTL